jgi:hypothetical protein
MGDRIKYRVILSGLQLLVGILAGGVLIARAQSEAYLQLLFYAAAAVLGLSLGIKGLIRFIRHDSK